MTDDDNAKALRPPPPKPESETVSATYGEPDDDPPMICPVTGMYCSHMSDPGCDEYGCNKAAGYYDDDDWFN